MFKRGDKVRYTERVASYNLIFNQIYEIEKLSRWSSSADVYLHLQGQPDCYNSLNFELVSDPESAPIQAAQRASKNDHGKPDLSLIPYIALKVEAQAFMVGERKYGRYNYTKGHKTSQLLAAAIRHIMAFNEGEENDPVDGQPHLGSARASISMLLRQRELGTLIDDRFIPPQGTEV